MDNFLTKRSVFYICSPSQRRTPLSAEPARTVRRGRSLEAGRAARRRKAECEIRVVGFLNRGASIAQRRSASRVLRMARGSPVQLGIFFIWLPRNPLKSPESAEGIQENLEGYVRSPARGLGVTNGDLT